MQGITRRAGAVALIAAAAIAPPAWSGQTDVTRAPGSWRGTLLEGTDTLIASNSYGEPLFVRIDDTVASILAPAPVDGERLAKEFKRLCLDTGFEEARLAEAVKGSSFALTNRTISVPSDKSGTYAASVWHSPEARVQIWSGDLAPLKNRETLSRWRGGMTSSPFKASRVLAPACNITVMATGFTNPAAFLTAVSGFVGAEPKKAVTKPDWADGNWSIANSDGSETRIVYSMVDFDKSEQLLHVGVARVAGKK